MAEKKVLFEKYLAAVHVLTEEEKNEKKNRMEDEEDLTV